MIFLNKLEIDIKTIILGGLSLFYLFILSYSLVIYQQFTILNIVNTGIVFLLIFLFLICVFLKCNFKDSFIIKTNIYNIGISILLSLFLLLFFFNEPSWLSYYYSTYPLIETDLGLFWHEDTAYHSSLIQSIINFGYPSIAQHDTVVRYYHVLSHYVDALVLIITGGEPYDSYGLLYHFKKWIIISSIVIFIGRLFINKSPVLFLIVLSLFLPLFLYSWHAIGSHGLWFTTILMLFIFPNIYIILQNKLVSIRNYIFLFMMIVIISLGKISTGFFFGVFIGFYLLLKNYRDYKIYVFGVLLIIFFIMMEYKLNQVSMINTYKIHMLFTYNGIWDFVAGIDREYSRTLLPIYIYIISSGLLFILLKKNEFKILCLSSILTFSVLLIVIQIGTFSTNNVGYFIYGLYCSLLLFFIVTFTSAISNIKNKLILCSFIVSIFIVTNNLSPYNEINIKHSFGNLNSKVFQKLNSQKLSSSEYVFLSKLIKDNYTINFPKNKYGLKQFRIKLYKYMKNEHLTKQNTLLYIPKNIYKTEISEKEWAKGMLVYAVLGVPLLNGLYDLRPAYGYSTYSHNALRKDIEEIDIEDMCKNKKTIIIINSFKNKNFSRLCK